MGFKKWQVSAVKKELAKELAAECDIDPIVALIAASRGYDDPAGLEEFLSDEPMFTSPLDTADIITAAEIVNAAVEDGVKITVYGDYDCDGVTATALMCTYLLSRGADCDYYIPDRFAEGYGMNEAAVRKIAENGTRLIITVDNGISALSEISLAKELGVDVVVTDHHLPGEELPDADAVVDPHRSDCPSEFKNICGAEVAFRLICVMENKEPEELLPYFADILTLAVLGDIMPLTEENRSIVKYGIRKMQASPATGLSALMSVAGLEQKSITAQNIAFGIAPRINAAGRMGSACRAVELLMSDSMMKALEIANEIDAENAKRQKIERVILGEAVSEIEKNGYNNDRVIVCSGIGWHHGVVGIVAGKISEKYGKPAILISSDDDGFAHGSGRSIEGFPLYDAIRSCSSLLVKFGGHDQAAGVTLKTEDIAGFRKEINRIAYGFERVFPVLRIDCRLTPAALTPDLAAALKALEPCGSGNPAPLFGLYGVTLKRITPIGNNKHLRLLFSKGENTFSAVLFGVSSEKFCFENEDVLDLAVSVEENIYKGEAGISVFVRAVRMSGTDDEKLFCDIENLEACFTGRKFDAAAILPDRSEVGKVYKYICEKPSSDSRIKYALMNSVGYGKVSSAVTALSELGLINTGNDGKLFAVKGAAKTELSASPTYRKLSEGGTGV